MRYDRDYVMSLLEANLVEVVFDKLDGSRRTMVCTLLPNHLPETGWQVEKVQRALPADVIRCYDVEKGAWRSFRMNTVLSVQIYNASSDDSVEPTKAVAVSQDEEEDNTPSLFSSLFATNTHTEDYTPPVEGGGGTFDGGGASASWNDDSSPSSSDSSSSSDDSSSSSSDDSSSSDSGSDSSSSE